VNEARFGYSRFFNSISPAKGTRLGGHNAYFRRADAQRLRAEGHSRREIARALEIPMSTVIDACRSENSRPN